MCWVRINISKKIANEDFVKQAIANTRLVPRIALGAQLCNFVIQTKSADNLRKHITALVRTQTAHLANMLAHNPGPGIFIAEHSKAKNGTQPSWIRITDEEDKAYYERVHAEARNLNHSSLQRL